MLENDISAIISAFINYLKDIVSINSRADLYIFILFSFIYECINLLCI